MKRRGGYCLSATSAFLCDLSSETSLVGVRKLGTVLKRPLQNAYLQLNASGAEGLSPIFPDF